MLAVTCLLHEHCPNCLCPCWHGTQTHLCTLSALCTCSKGIQAKTSLLYDHHKSGCQPLTHVQSHARSPAFLCDVAKHWSPTAPVCMSLMVCASVAQVICTKVRDGDKRIVRLKEGEPRGRHVVIVDDLVQSGGTLRECQKLLSTQVQAPSCINYYVLTTTYSLNAT